MNTTTAIAADGPLHVSSDINKAATGIGFYWADGQVTETLHARPAEVIAYIDDAVLGNRMAKALADDVITNEQAVEFAALISTPAKIGDDATIIHHDMFSPEERPILERFVALGKAQILELMQSGRIPNDCTSFGDLHDYCDANELGDVCVDYVNDRADAYLRKDTDEADCMSQGLQDFTNKMQDILDQWLRLRQPDPHGHDTAFGKIATPFKVAVDGSEEVFSAFTIGQSWNGWAYPYFIKDIGELLAEELSDIADMPSIHYDASIDAFVDITDIGDGETQRDEYKGEDIVTADGVVHVYAIGSGGWTWSVVDPIFDEDDAGPVTETPEHDAMTLHAAYLRLQDAALDLRQELGACAEQGRNSHEQDSDLWPSGEEILEALEAWAEASADDISKEGAK